MPRLKGQESSSERQAKILGQLYRTGHVAVSALSSDLRVSTMTVRRDLRMLADEGLLHLVHGGATVSAPDGAVPPFSDRATSQAAAKRKIGAAAVATLGTEDVIAIDAGTTALEVALQLPGEFTGTVVTHSVPVLSAILSRPDPHAVGLGGDLLPRSRCLIGSAGVALARTLRVNKLFLGASAVDERGVYAHSTLELDMKWAMMDAADEVILLCDRSKLQAAGAVRLDGGLDRIHALITDAAFIPEPLAGALQQANVDLITV